MANFSTVNYRFEDAQGVPTYVKNPTVSGSGATVTITPQQSGATFLFDRAAGIVYTLPAPQVGLMYNFLVTTAVTSNAYTVQTDAGTTFLAGVVASAVAAGTGSTFFGNGSTHIKVAQNGTTTGGLIGSVLYVTCVTPTLWNVEASLYGSGTLATPFST